MNPFNTEAYSWLLEQTDIFYQRARTTNLEVSPFVSIPRDAESVWRVQRRPDEVICDEHAEVGNGWIKLAAANRIRRRLIEDNLIDSEEGQDLFRIHIWLKNLVNHSVDNIREIRESSYEDEEMETESEDNEDLDDEAADDEVGGDVIREDIDDRDAEVKEEPSASPVLHSHADPMDGIMNGNDVGANLGDLARRVGVLENNSSPHVLATKTSTTQPSEPRQAGSEGQVVPHRPAAEVAQLPLPDSTVIQRELAKIRAWIASENCILVCEMGDLTSVESNDDRTYNLRNSQGLLGCVRDADAYNMVGSYAIFYRFRKE